MATTNDIVEMINAAVEAKTFSLDGMEAIKAIRDKAKALQAINEQLVVDLERARKSNDDLKNVIKTQDAEISIFNGREDAIKNREAKMFELEKSVAVSEAVRFAQDTMFTRMFANRQYRETIMDSTSKAIPPVPGSGMTYPTTHTETATRTVEREDK